MMSYYEKKDLFISNIDHFCKYFLFYNFDYKEKVGHPKAFKRKHLSSELKRNGVFQKILFNFGP